MVRIESFVARQPIFDKDENVFAYELLYRDGFENAYNPDIDGEEATSQVLTSSFGVIGIEEITDGHHAFVNFTEKLLIEQVATVFNTDTLVVEVLEDINPSSEVIEACQNLKKMGYTIALDDFIFAPKYQPLVDLADIIKVDFMISSREERSELVEISQKKGIELLAEKVETREELEEAKEMGYTYFQGYFFSEPVVLKGDDLPVYPTNYIRVLDQLNTVEPDLDEIAKFIEQDMSLSYKLLRLINSAMFSLPKEIDSIKQALILLGLDEVKKWFNLMIIDELSDEEDLEAVRLSLVRAKFAELLANSLSIKRSKNKFFLMGLFSMIDVLMNRTLDDLLTELPIAQEIKDGLLREGGIYTKIMDLIIAYEKGEWDKIHNYFHKKGLKDEIVSEAYLQAIDWSNKISAENFD